MKKVILMLVVALSVATANAQFNVGVNAGVQQLMESGGYTGFGGSANAEFLITPLLGVGVNAGYYILDRESIGDMTITSYLMPIVLNVKGYTSTEAFRPYGGLDIGVYTIGVSGKYEGSYISASASATSRKFGLGPVVGFQYGLNNYVAFDANVKYSYVFLGEKSYSGFFGIHAGLVFTFGRK